MNIVCLYSNHNGIACNFSTSKERVHINYTLLFSILTEKKLTVLVNYNGKNFILNALKITTLQLLLNIRDGYRWKLPSAVFCTYVDVVWLLICPKRYLKFWMINFVFSFFFQIYLILYMLTLVYENNAIHVSCNF